MWCYVRDLYRWPCIAETVRLDEIKLQYYKEFTGLNPSGIVPLGGEPALA